MIFSSTIFLFLFLPCVLLGYYGLFRKSRKWQNIFLLFSSLFFYGWGEPAVVFIMIVSIMINWGLGLGVKKFEYGSNKAKGIIALAVVLNLALLFYFKYLGFTVEIINSVLSVAIPVPKIALPIGISFFTFQGLSYVLDVYRGKGEVQKNPMNVGLYIALFPQLIAGPIVRYETVAHDILYRKENLTDFCDGITRFIIGFSKKVLLSNTLAVIADNAFAVENGSELSVSFAWLGALAYTFQIFFDFSGYSDMAIGLGKMFGFHFLENFDYPYISKSISEFWRRWHISLGTWFRDYVYFPLGGSRVNSKARLVFNLFVVWFLTGVWHGANWTFILWGLFYFVFIALEKLSGFEKKFPKLNWLKHIYTLLLVIFGWVLFRADNVSSAFTYMGSMLGLNGNLIMDDTTIFYLTENIVFLIAALVFSIPTAKWIGNKLNNKSVVLDVVYTIGILIVFMIAVSYIIKGAYNPFIYFNF